MTAVTALLAALESSALASSIRDSLYLFPLIESAHVLGLTLVFGTILIIDLRLLGLASARRPFSALAADVLTWTWAAFAVTITTGALMFVTNASGYAANAYFRAKMTLLLVAGVNMLVFELTARRSLHQWDSRPSAPRAGKVVAALSLAVWIAVIVLGRWIGFTSTSAPAPAGEEIDFEELEDLISQ